MNLDTLVTIGILLAVIYYWFKDNVFPQRHATSSDDEHADRADGTPARARSRGFKLRSRRSERSNAVNAGSGHWERVQDGVNVHANVQRSGELPAQPLQNTPIDAPTVNANAPTVQTPGELTMTLVELQKLVAAIELRAKGGTVEEALGTAFGVKKGGSEAYKRAKSLFDAATAPPLVK